MGQQSFYVRDFLHVIDSVVASYGPELNEVEQRFIENVLSLSPSALCLFVRLLNRSKRFYRVSKLTYAECIPVEAALKGLNMRELIDVLTVDHEKIHALIVDGFTLPELGNFAKRCGRAKCKTKADYVGWLQTLDANHPHFYAWFSEHPQVAPRRDTWQFIAYLYFGEITPNLSAFVVRELGHLTPETVMPLAFERTFASRHHAEISYRHDQQYEQFRIVRQSLTGIELYKWWKQAALPLPVDATSSAKHDKLVHRLGQLLVKAQCDDLAIHVYRDCISDLCLLPLAKLLRKKGNTAEAIDLCHRCIDGATDPEIVHQAWFLLQRLSGKRARSQTHTRLASEPFTDIKKQGSVELSALHHFAQEGWSGVHSENWLWSALFGLALWEVIYDPAFGGFHNSLQLAPADLWRPEFYAKRAVAIDDKIRSFATAELLLSQVTRTLKAKTSVTNPFFRASDDLHGHLTRLCTLLPLAGLKATLRRMASDPGTFLRGFPDLFLWQGVSYRFAEVKSPNDHLSPYQLDWIRSLNAFGIKAEILRVRVA